MIQRTTTVIDWRRPVRTLLELLLKHGVELLATEHEDRVELEGLPPAKQVERAVRELTACDEAYLYVRAPDGIECAMLLVLGNDYSEIVADYTVNEYLDRATGEFYDRYSGVGYVKVDSHYCICDRTGRHFVVYGDERTDICPSEVEADFAKVKEAYFEVTGYTGVSLESLNMDDSNIRDLHVGTYESSRAFVKERVAQQFEEEIHENSELWGFLNDFLDWDQVEDEMFSSTGYGYEKAELDGRVYIFDGNA